MCAAGCLGLRQDGSLEESNIALDGERLRYNLAPDPKYVSLGLVDGFGCVAGRCWSTESRGSGRSSKPEK